MNTKDKKYEFDDSYYQVSVTVDPLPGLEVDEKTPLTREICVCEDTSPFHFEVRAKVSENAEVGNLNVTVTATNSDNLAVCEGKDAKSVASRDKITRQLKIVPEGILFTMINVSSCL